MNLSNQQLWILLFILVLIAVVVGKFFKSFFKFFLSIVLVITAFVFTFNFLPNLMTKYDKGEIVAEDVPGEIVEGFKGEIPQQVGENLNKTASYINENKDTVLDTFFKFWEGVFNSATKKNPTESPEASATTEN